MNSKLDVSMLPKEYGGTIPMKEMIGNSRLFKYLSYHSIPELINFKYSFYDTVLIQIYGGKRY